MATKTTTELKDIFEKYRYDRDIAQKSQTWFTQQVTLLNKKRITPNQVLRSEHARNRPNLVPGKMYVFFYDPKTKEFRRANTRRGIADVMATKRIEHQGRVFAITVAIEIKYGNDKLSEYQHRIKDDIERAGGVYLVARTWDQFINDWNKI